MDHINHFTLMKAPLLYLATMLAVALGLCAALVSTTSAQGPLTPPGPPAPTFKTLEQIEPRTPISSLPFPITQPGSYYLTTNLIGVSNAHGVIIAADDVTLDLMGFALIGVPGSSNGVAVPGRQVNLTIRHGTIRNWGQHGVESSRAVNSQFLDLRASNNGVRGVEESAGLRVGVGSLVRDCVVTANEYIGIRTRGGCVVSHCVAYTNSGAGILVEDSCTVSQCSVSYTYQSPLQPAGISPGILTGFNCTVVGCTLQFNPVGIQTGVNCVLVNNACYQNRSGVPGSPGVGMRVSFAGNHLENNVASGNDIGFDCSSAIRTTMVRCNAVANFGHGILGGDSFTVRDCSASLNMGHGIQVGGDSVVADSDCRQNTGTGIHVTGARNRIESNHLVANATGIRVTTTNGLNFVARNTAVTNATANYNIAPGNKNAAAVTPASNFGSADPWANFSF